MQWVLDNWLVLLLVGGMFAMHLGHGMHGGKGGHGAGKGDAGGAGGGGCKSTGHKCCGGHKEKPESELEAETDAPTGTVKGKSQIPKISPVAKEA